MAGLICLLTWLSGGFEEDPSVAIKEQLDEHNGHLDAYLRVARQVAGPENNARPRGPFAVVTLATNSRNIGDSTRDLYALDPIMTKLPASALPQNGERAKTLVSLHFGQQHVAGYEGGAKAMRETCAVRVFDMDSELLI
ncbi:MAG: hypothetical protein AAFP90_13245, partial [Planctomycetota bacterium]